MSNQNVTLKTDADSSSYEKLLGTLADYGCELRNGYTSHAPMVIEALMHLDRVDAIAAWLESARPNLLERPHLIEAIRWHDCDAGHPALGKPERFSDWAVFFADEIAVAGWRSTAARWTGHLADGFASAALHGVIRVGHAVRALDDRDTPERRRELADALASWACVYSPFALPLVLSDGRSPPREVLAQLPRIPDSARRNDGSIVAALGQLSLAAGFVNAIAVARLNADSRRALSDIASAFAEVFVAEVTSSLTAVVFTHAITAAAAASHLLRVADAELGRVLVWRAWQSGCALIATYANQVGGAEPIAASSEACEPSGLVDAAIACGDDHAIKLTEAALFFYKGSNDPVLLQAAALGVRTLSGAR